MKSQTYKRAISCVMILIMLLSIISVMSVSAEATGTTEDGFVYEISNGEVTIIDYPSEATHLTFPAEIEGYPVKTIERNGDWGVYFIESVVIPYGVTTIGVNAFYYCQYLKSVELPDSIISIEASAFMNCERLEDIEIPSSVKNIGAYAFMFCENIKSLVVPEGVEIINDYAFHACTKMESIVIPEGVKSIEEGALGACHKLENVDIPASVTSIGSMAFSECESFTSIEIPDGVTKIPDSAFSWCFNLESITIPDSVTSIGKEAFLDCNSLTNVYFKGTQEQWNAIKIWDDNECLANATVHFYEPVAEVVGNSITLSGDIGVNFFMDIPERVFADDEAIVVLTYNNETVQVPVSEGTETENGYKYTCYIPAIDMTTEVTCKVVTSTEVSEEYTCTVRDYAEVILANPDKYGEEAVALVKAMLNYGANSQVYFNYCIDKLANDNLSEEDRVLDDVKLSTYRSSSSGSEPGIRHHGTSLTLKSKTELNIYFIIEDESNIPEFYVNGEVATPVKVGDFYRIKIEDIAAQDLGKEYVVTVGNLKVKSSAMSYGYAAMYSMDENIKNVAKAMYAYNQAAIAYLSAEN